MKRAAHAGRVHTRSEIAVGSRRRHVWVHSRRVHRLAMSVSMIAAIAARRPATSIIPGSGG
jgi:hypothetical protein